MRRRASPAAQRRDRRRDRGCPFGRVDGAQAGEEGGDCESGRSVGDGASGRSVRLSRVGGKGCHRCRAQRAESVTSVGAKYEHIVC